MQKKHLIGAGITAFSVILGLLWLIPLIWLIGTAFSVPSFHMTLFPTTAFTLDNIKYVWNAIPFGTYYINTLTLVVCTFAVQFFTSTLAAYALAVLDFKGQALVFAVIFMQIIIPNDVLITPNFMTLSDLKLIDTKIGMMLPFYGQCTVGRRVGHDQRPQVVVPVVADRDNGKGKICRFCTWHVYTPDGLPGIGTVDLCCLSQCLWNGFKVLTE